MTYEIFPPATHRGGEEGKWSYDFAELYVAELYVAELKILFKKQTIYAENGHTPGKILFYSCCGTLPPSFCQKNF